MFFHKYNFSKNKEIYTLGFLILFSIIIRIPIVFIFGDSNLEYEWKLLVENLVEYKQLGWKNCEFAYSFTEICFEDAFLLPNLWMPPLYAYYLYFFTFFNLEQQNYILLILSSQILFASVSVVIFYEINKFFFSKKISLYSSLFLSLFPLYVYSSVQISSISMQVFLTILFLYFFLKLVKKENFLSTTLFAFIAGLLMLLRGEFYAVLILSLFYLLFLKVKIKNILLIILVFLFTVSPYLVRNVLIFEKVTMVKSFGYNLWKGNHPYAVKNSLIVGSEIVDETLQKKLDDVPRDKFLRFNFDKIFLDRTIKNIKEDPTGHLILFFKKGVSFLLIDFNSPDPNYYNPLHYLPVLLLGITSLIGISLSYNKSYEFKYFILIFFIYVFIFSTVSILPRYKLIILPMQIILANVFVEFIVKKFIHRHE